MLKGFNYIANNNCEILILGTFPGEQSRKKSEYYGNNRNQFWKILYNIFNEEYSNSISYNEKIEFILRHNIAIWDTVHKCITYGSLDNKIKEPIFNDIETFLSKHKSIKKVYCNGKTAYNFLNKQKLDIEVQVLPSSSPTNTMKYETKLLIWKESIIIEK